MTRPKKASRPNAARPYALPQLLDSSTAHSPEHIEMYCQWAIKAAWAAGDRGARGAAREKIAHCQLNPATIAAMARWLADYNRRWSRERQDVAANDQKIDWLTTGSGCVQRFGTKREAHLAAWTALEAAMSILVDVPLEHDEDEAELLSTLIHTGWRHVPLHKQARTARRMAGYVRDCILERPFVPIGGAR